MQYRSCRSGTFWKPDRDVGRSASWGAEPSHPAQCRGKQSQDRNAGPPLDRYVADQMRAILRPVPGQQTLTADFRPDQFFPPRQRTDPGRTGVPTRVQYFCRQGRGQGHLTPPTGCQDERRGRRSGIGPSASVPTQSHQAVAPGGCAAVRPVREQVADLMRNGAERRRGGHHRELPAPGALPQGDATARGVPDMCAKPVRDQKHQPTACRCELPAGLLAEGGNRRRRHVPAVRAPRRKATFGRIARQCVIEPEGWKRNRPGCPGTSADPAEPVDDIVQRPGAGRRARAAQGHDSEVLRKCRPAHRISRSRRTITRPSGPKTTPISALSSQSSQ